MFLKNDSLWLFDHVIIFEFLGHSKDNYRMDIQLFWSDVLSSGAIDKAL